jgi:ferritin-like metal-binding protein YciE
VGYAQSRKRRVALRRRVKSKPKTRITMSSLHSLQDLLADELKDLYNAENQLTKALPKMAKAASNEELKQGFLDHLEETKVHVERLAKAFKLLKLPVKGKTCHAMKGLIEEGTEAIEVKAPDAVRDAQLIGAAQRVEHYEMAAYGTARAFAEALGENDVAELLQETLDEEGETNKKLTALSQTVNAEALVAAESEDE